MIWLLYQVKLVVIPLMLGAFVASLGTPVVGWLDAKGRVEVMDNATDLVFVAATDVASVRGLHKTIDALDRIGMTGARRHFVLNRADASVTASTLYANLSFSTGLAFVIPAPGSAARRTTRSGTRAGRQGREGRPRPDVRLGCTPGRARSKPRTRYGATT